MSQRLRLEFREDHSGYSRNELKKVGSGFRYLLGKNGFDPANRNDVRDLIEALMKFEEFEEIEEKELTHQIERFRTEELLERAQELRV